VWWLIAALLDGPVAEPPSSLPALPVLPAPRPVSTSPVIVELLGGIATSFDGTQAGSLGVRALRHDWSAELALDLAIPETDAMVDVSRGGAELAVCRHLGPLALCPIANVGWIRTSGPGVESSTSPLASVGARLAAELQISHRIAFRARGDGRILLTSSAFTSRVEGWFGLDMVVRIR
jgi:hypothetical protein